MLLIARCQCGYEKDVALGGGMAGDNETFPFYCRRCGLTDVRVASPDKNGRCRRCRSGAVLPYGAPPHLEAGREGSCRKVGRV